MKMTTTTKTAKKTSNVSLKAQVAAIQKANAKKIAEAVEKSNLKAVLAQESSKELFDSRVLLAMSSKNTATLKSLVNQCEILIDNTPVHNPNTGKSRAWNGQRRFAFGTHINLVYQLATGIQYSVGEHKTHLLALTGLDEDLIEAFLESFGAPSYYSKNENVVVPARMYDLDGVMSALMVIQSSLGVVLDTSKLTVDNLSIEFAQGQTRADKEFIKAEEAISDATLDV